MLAMTGRRGRHSGIRGRARLVAGATVVVALLFAAATIAASAHPLGNFTINHYSELVFSANQVKLHYVLDFAEIPTVQRKGAVDSDGDGTLSEVEQVDFFKSELLVLLPGVVLELDGEPVVWSVDATHVELLPGQAGLQTLRIELDLSAPLSDRLSTEELSATYADKNYGERLGWREIVVLAHDGARIVETSAPSTSLSDELRTYPVELLSAPPDNRVAEIVVGPGDAGSALGSQNSQPEDTQRATGGRLASLVELDHLTPAVIVVSLLAAFAWGAAHALTPGHGKAVVAAYLVGTRGTARHAALLASIVTLTHTAGVFALAIVTLSLSSFILPERLYPWLTVLSGVLVLSLGLTLLVNRVRAWRAPASATTTGLDTAEHARLHAEGARHNHDGFSHQHAMPGADGSRVTPRSLLALGVSGGLVPCPSALVLLLGAIAAGQAAYGMVLVLAFSVGLAIVLLGIGLIVVYARWLVRRFSFEPRVPRLLPALSAAAISVAGLLLVADSLGQVGML